MNPRNNLLSEKGALVLEENKLFSYQNCSNSVFFLKQDKLGLKRFVFSICLKMSHGVGWGL